jgi:hypothetical protein
VYELDNPLASSSVRDTKCRGLMQVTTTWRS